MSQGKPKTRPNDNVHCFNGLGRRYWQLKARGFAPEIVNGPEGYRVMQRTEREVLGQNGPENADAFAYQNGGMRHPQETTMRPGTYLRFHDSKSTWWVGGWWIDYENYTKIRHFAQTWDVPIAVGARECLAIPTEWGDCGRLVLAGLNRRLGAYVGKGKSATGTVSPFNAARDPAQQRTYLPPQHLEIKQWFVPGEGSQLADFFEKRDSFNVLLKGAGP